MCYQKIGGLMTAYKKTCTFHLITPQVVNPIFRRQKSRFLPTFRFFDRTYINAVIALYTLIIIYNRIFEALFIGHHGYSISRT